MSLGSRLSAHGCRAPIQYHEVAINCSKGHARFVPLVKRCVMPLLLILSVDGGLVECGCLHVGMRSLALPYVLAARHRLDVRRSDGVYPLQWWRPTVFERPQRGVGMRYLDSDEAVADICLSPLGDAATASERELGRGALVPNQVVDYVRDLIAAKEEPLGTAYMEIKRLNHEVVDRIRTWLQAFGHNGAVGVALRVDVYKTANLADAQDEGVSIFWSHVLCTLGDVLRRTGIRTR